MGDQPSQAFSPRSLGHGGWNELHASDGAAALAFYTKHFGWSESRAMDMGPMGTYYVFETGDGVDTGGIMTDSNFPTPAWLYYFNTEDIDAAKTRVEAAGGAVIFGPMEVPGPMMVLTATDPHGALFALVAPKT